MCLFVPVDAVVSDVEAFGDGRKAKSPGYREVDLLALPVAADGAAFSWCPHHAPRLSFAARNRSLTTARNQAEREIFCSLAALSTAIKKAREHLMTITSS